MQIFRDKPMCSRIANEKNVRTKCNHAILLVLGHQKLENIHFILMSLKKNQFQIQRILVPCISVFVLDT